MTKLAGDGRVFLTEQPSAGVDVPGDGQIWVKDDTPNVLKFTDDAGQDFDISTATAASQAEQEAGTEAGKYVAPLTQQHHPSAAKLWVNFDASSGTPTIQSSYNITSITDSGVGNFTVNIADGFSAAYQCIVLGAGLSGFRVACDLATKSSVAVGSFSAISSNQTSGALIDASVFTAVGYGDQ